MDDAPVPISSFTRSEITEMENLFEQFGEATLSQEFCHDLAISFSAPSGCSRNISTRCEEVRDWFLNKQKKVHAEGTSSSLVTASGILALPEASMSNNALQNSIVPRVGKVAQDLLELAYEAKSSKDDAWYDVAAFLTYRVLSNGELEARVRFSGFNNEEDEWVNVKRGIRERSIPLEPSECHRVQVGDLVLCFQERTDQAVYCDAHVMEIQRRLHDIKGCRCIFLVRYEHDNAEEKVSLKRLCCRPRQYNHAKLELETRYRDQID